MKKIALVFCVFLFSPLLWAQETPAGSEENPAPSASGGLVPVETNAAGLALASDSEDIPELDIETLLRRRIAETAQEYLGVSYRYAGVTPEGFDCSGFVYFVFREAAGMELSRSTVVLWNSGKAVKLVDVKPGDLLIFTTVRPGASHVGIVLENSPQGITFAHAASKGSKTGVIISNLNEAYYKSRVMGARSYF